MKPFYLPNWPESTPVCLQSLAFASPGEESRKAGLDSSKAPTSGCYTVSSLVSPKAFPRLGLQRRWKEESTLFPTPLHGFTVRTSAM